ncbi:hypothetical protein Pan216_51040 [Planctomycetes bacterium Pan216]|uniref:Uncharacterized protein n=1 Tax=Kolteria novifilia TaxID=2527975 RepID=A0A518BB57_9BACT|nr:hypothetical protein Pan216_51040 [Planctomycetes bacterium Pan216]
MLSCMEFATPESLEGFPKLKAVRLSKIVPPWATERLPIDPTNSKARWLWSTPNRPWMLRHQTHVLCSTSELAEIIGTPGPEGEARSSTRTMQRGSSSATWGWTASMTMMIPVKTGPKRCSGWRERRNSGKSQANSLTYKSLDEVTVDQPDRGPPDSRRGPGPMPKALTSEAQGRVSRTLGWDHAACRKPWKGFLKEVRGGRSVARRVKKHLRRLEDVWSVPRVRKARPWASLDNGVAVKERGTVVGIGDVDG